MNGHRLEVADVFRIHEDDFLARWGHVLSPRQKKAFADIRDCRTAAFGGHVEHYDCGHRVISYNSCNNRSCPKCQGAARAKWLAEREAELLPVKQYFHVVFTLPQQIAAMALQNAKIIYGILFRAMAETMLTIAADPQHLAARIGFLAVLHTWGQNLMPIPMFIVWFPAAESAPTTPGGSPVASRSSFPSRSSVASSARGSCFACARRSGRANCTFTASWKRWLNQQPSKHYVKRSLTSIG